MHLSLAGGTHAPRRLRAVGHPGRRLGRGRAVARRRAPGAARRPGVELPPAGRDACCERTGAIAHPVPTGGSAEEAASAYAREIRRARPRGAGRRPGARSRASGPRGGRAHRLALPPRPGARGPGRGMRRGARRAQAAARPRQPDARRAAGRPPVVDPRRRRGARHSAVAGGPLRSRPGRARQPARRRAAGADPRPCRRPRAPGRARPGRHNEARRTWPPPSPRSPSAPPGTRWRRHLDEIRGTAPAHAVRRRPRPRRADDAPRAPASTSTTPRTGSPTRRCGCSAALAEECGDARAPRGDVPRRADQRLRGPPGPARGAADAARPLARRRRRRRRQGGPRGARPDGRLLRAGPERRVARPHRQADPQRDQHRDRRLGPGAGDGLRGAAPLLEARDDLSLRLQRRRHRLRRGDPRPRPRGDAVHRLLEDLHDARDDDQRPHRARVGRWTRWATRPRSPSTSSPSRPTPRGCRSSASTPTTCSASGSGSAGATRWTRRSGSRPCSPSGPSGSSEMLAGFHAMDEHFLEAPLERNLPGADGPARRLVRGLLRRPDGRGPALRPVPAPLPGLPPAADDGVERQARDARRGTRSTTRRGPSTGASPGPTASTPSTS